DRSFSRVHRKVLRPVFCARVNRIFCEKAVFGFKIEKSCAIIRIRKHIYATIPFENSVLNYFRKENFRDE
ncbi:hypothetical protein, partial [Hominenteromicrobium sp.]|uniref:hypothetical protein n=1 Tax=Hominenteromicrobium sp. TaxID=3073581 RepID=UPI003992EBB3